MTCLSNIYIIILSKSGCDVSSVSLKVKQQIHGLSSLQADGGAKPLVSFTAVVYSGCEIRILKAENVEVYF